MVPCSVLNISVPLKNSPQTSKGFRSSQLDGGQNKTFPNLSGKYDQRWLGFRVRFWTLPSFYIYLNIYKWQSNEENYPNYTYPFPLKLDNTSQPGKNISKEKVNKNTTNKLND